MILRPLIYLLLWWMNRDLNRRAAARTAYWEQLQEARRG